MSEINSLNEFTAGTKAEAAKVGGNDETLRLGHNAQEASITALEADVAALETEVKPATEGGTGQSSYTAGDLLYASSSTALAKLGIGAEGTFVKSVAGIPAWASITPPVFENKLFHVQDQKSAGTHGGAFTAGAWRTRDLNTSLTNEIAGASLNSNVITLPAGTYYCEGSAPTYGVNGHQTRLRKTNGTAADLLIGTYENSSSSNNVSTRSYVYGRFELAEESTIELQHYCLSTTATYGFGYVQSGIDSKNGVFSDLRIWKVA